MTLEADLAAILRRADNELDTLRTDVTALTESVTSYSEQLANATEALKIATEERAAAVRALADHMTTHEPQPRLTDTFDDLTGWLNPYHGAGAHEKQGTRLRTNVENNDNTLTIHCRPTTTPTTLGTRTIPTGAWTAGGIMHREILTPGTRITLQLRMNPSTGTRAVALLWPHQLPWPEGGELDFTENGGDIPDRQSTAITNHWAGPNGHAQKVIKFGPHDFTQWTHVQVDWTDTFTITINGQVAATYTDHVPTTPMKLAIQTAVAGGGDSDTFNGQPRTPGWIQIRQLRIYDTP